MTILAIASLLFIGVAEPAVQATPTQAPARPNTWSATSSSGLRLAGTWTATEDPATGAVTGTWTLVNAQGSTIARGAWAAAKSATGWNGGWRATVAGRAGEYSGTWSTRVDLKPDARFADLFEKAAQTVVSGAWRSGGQSGAWSIQAFKP
jgi:hypothetical protein